MMAGYGVNIDTNIIHPDHYVLAGSASENGLIISVVPRVLLQEEQIRREHAEIMKNIGAATLDKMKRSPWDTGD